MSVASRSKTPGSFVAVGLWLSFVLLLAGCFRFGIDIGGEPDAGADADSDTDSDAEPRCEEGETGDCYTGPSETMDVGSCEHGSRTCNGGVWGNCVGETLPAVEVCDDEDNDCNGEADDGLVDSCYTGPPGTEGVGDCRAGEAVCRRGEWLCEDEITPAVLCGDFACGSACGVECGEGCTSPETCLDGRCESICDGFDGFGDNDRDNDGTEDPLGETPGVLVGGDDGGYRFHLLNGAGLGVVSDDSSPISANALYLDASETGFTSTWTRAVGLGLPTISLEEEGDYIELRFDFKMAGSYTGAAQVAGVRAGLFLSRGDPVTADGQDGNTWGDPGISMQLGVGGNATGRLIYETEAHADRLLGGALSAWNEDEGFLREPLLLGQVHTVELMLTRLADGSVNVALELDENGHRLSSPCPERSITEFNEIVFGTGSTEGLDLVIDNVCITHHARH